MLHEEVPQRSIKSMLNVGCGMLQDHEDRQESRWQDVITPPPPPETRTPPHPPPKGSAEKHEELPKVARTSVEKSATDHTRCSEVTMIWKETRKWRGLRSPSEPKKKDDGHW